jgi:cell division transport system ATP-binding protein
MFSSDPVVRVTGASVCQDGHAVLSNISFEIAKGEFVFLVGRTGSGKSSLLKTLYADLPLTSGEISIAGFSIRDLPGSKVPMLRRKLGIVFQDFQLLPDRSVGDNLTFVMKATGWKDSTKIKVRLSDVLMQVGLGGVEKKLPHQLSGGEQQRVVIARALINEPHLLIADEPTGNLDPEVALDILKLFQTINRSGTAVLMATHQYGLIRSFPARILKCENGQLLDSQKDTIALPPETTLQA